MLMVHVRLFLPLMRCHCLSWAGVQTTKEAGLSPAALMLDALGDGNVEPAQGEAGHGSAAGSAAAAAERTVLDQERSAGDTGGKGVQVIGGRAASAAPPQHRGADAGQPLHRGANQDAAQPSALGNSEADSGGESDRSRDGSPDSGPSESDAGAAERPRRRRRTLLPKVSRASRCGECHTCRNPHLKKACLQRRQEQLQQLDASGEIPLLLLPQFQTLASGGAAPNCRAAAAPAAPRLPAAPPPAAAAAAPPPAKRHKARPNYAELDGGAVPARAVPAAPAPAPAPDDPVTRELQQIVGRRGGLASARVAPRLVRLLAAPGLGLEMRFVLLHILGSSEPDAQRALVRGGALAPLEAWLAEAGAAAADAALVRLAQARVPPCSCAPLPLVTQ